MNEDDDFPFGKDEIGAAGQVPIMQTIADPFIVEASS
jgi:hypothetical protein